MIEFKMQQGISELIWRMRAKDEAQYRLDWKRRLETGATSGVYRVDCITINGKPCTSQYNTDDVVATFTDDVESPYAQIKS